MAFMTYSGSHRCFISKLTFLICVFFLQIPPPSINFTLPSPILGMPCVPMFDPPWVPVNTGTVPDAITEDQSVGLPCWCLNYVKEKNKGKIIQKYLINQIVLVKPLKPHIETHTPDIYTLVTPSKCLIFTLMCKVLNQQNYNTLEFDLNLCPLYC